MNARLSRVKVRQARPDDLEAYLQLQQKSWGEEMAVARNRAEIRFENCLDGILMAEVDGEVVGTTTMIKLLTYDLEQPKSWDQTTDEGWCTTHDPKGSIGFGVDLSARGARILGAVDALMVACMAKTIRWGVEYTVLGARMPGFAEWLDQHTHQNEQEAAREYLFGRKANGEYLDTEIQMYSVIPGNRLLRLIPNYFEDPKSHNYGALFRWGNPVYRLRWIPGSRRVFARVPPLALRAWSYFEHRKTRKQVAAPVPVPTPMNMPTPRALSREPVPGEFGQS